MIKTYKTYEWFCKIFYGTDEEEQTFDQYKHLEDLFNQTNTAGLELIQEYAAEIDGQIELIHKYKITFICDDWVTFESHEFIVAHDIDTKTWSFIV